MLAYLVLSFRRPDGKSGLPRVRAGKFRRISLIASKFALDYTYVECHVDGLAICPREPLHRQRIL